MSKLVDKLEQAGGSSPPMGFGAARARTKTVPMLVIARLPRPDREMAALAVRGGADAVIVSLVHADKEDEALSQTLKALEGLPWGAAPDELGAEGLSHLKEKGCDFAVFGSDRAAAGVLLEEEVGKVMEVETSLPDSQAAILDPLPIDALLVKGEFAPLTVQRVVELQRLGDLTGKPLLCLATQAPLKGDLESLMEAGVRGLVLDLSGDGKGELLGALRQAVDALPAARRKPRRRVGAAILPSYGAVEVEEEEEEEEEDLMGPKGL
ncbi:MAG: hypothetical protein Q8O76_10905 [Chloroflexota bacterium]|nr:hypothetical protein [Chloroflexota bacterium]